MPNRDDFAASVKNLLAQRVGYCCSNPDCCRQTSGPEATADGAVNIGVAAHITAAAPGGPRFDPQMASGQRSAAANGIWLCSACSSLIDRDVARYTQTLLLEWKASAEKRAQSYLQTPGRPEGRDEPILLLPSSDPNVSWLPFSSRATSFVGRDDERAQLDAFLESDRKITWWVLTGAAGAGKSRLALELCHDARPKWNAGFLSRTDPFIRWSHFRPSRPTLIIIDYVSSRAAHVSELVLQLARSADYLPSPVRVLLLERDLGSWWPRILREDSHSESADLIECLYDSPLQLGGLAPEVLRILAADVALSQGKSWTHSVARSFEMRMRTLDPFGRPLFGMMVAAYPGNEAGDAAVDSTLLRFILKKETGRRREAIPDAHQLRRVENLIVLATLVGGLLPISGSFAFLTDTDVASLIPDLAVVDPQVYRELVPAMGDESILGGLQPDILGERFVLDQLAVRGGFVAAAERLVRTAWALQPDDFCDFVVRSASDFPGDESLNALCDVPLITPEERRRWGRLVADLVRVANSSTEKISSKLLAKLRKLSSMYPEDDELRTEVARSEFCLGNIFLFSERDYAQAATQFEIAITLAGVGIDIEAGAINNRGILHQLIKDEDRAFDDWSDVISKGGISDEARACSLNNRADIFARRGEHEAAIRDRTEVLSLRETSPDRRYIALVRRSNSYFTLGRDKHALRDIEDILSTEDISPEQKGEARLTRAEFLRDLGHLVEAREDLEAVVNSEALFPSTAPAALVELSELARLEHDLDRAREYIEMAMESSDIDDSTLVEALIVNARLLTDAGDAVSAESIWQSILTNPNASGRQKSIAANRGAASI